MIAIASYSTCLRTMNIIFYLFHPGQYLRHSNEEVNDVGAYKAEWLFQQN